jgi:hypothetical protein
MVQWVHVAGETTIIARESGEVSFLPLDGLEGESAAFAGRMVTGGGTLVSTTGVLDGAIRSRAETTWPVGVSCRLGWTAGSRRDLPYR